MVTLGQYALLNFSNYTSSKTKKKINQTINKLANMKNKTEKEEL
jgi:hypothetical protein